MSKSTRILLALFGALLIISHHRNLHRYVQDALAEDQTTQVLLSYLNEFNQSIKSLVHVASTTSTTTQSPNDSPVVIGHVVSLIKCSKSRAYNEAGFLDAAAVLRHSIHKQSVHGPNAPSKYSYQMYAIIHEDCAHTAAPLQRLGYTPIIRPSPVLLEDISPGWYRDHVESENCCGSKEFIKLYAYNLTEHPITIHWDMDVAILQPLDDLFDAMLYDKSSPEGQAARSRLELQHPNYDALPDRIDAYFTRDVTSAKPWEKHQGVQGGFMVARPDPTVLDKYVQFIKEGNYKAGRSATSGWAGLGYGGFQGAMAIQGVWAYYYDQIAPNTAVELNVCRWNQVVADILWRGPEQMDHNGTCREYPRQGDPMTNTQCEDCRVTPIEHVKTVHYTACKKPWECTVPHPRNPRDKRQVYRLSHLTNVTTCLALHREWFQLRSEFEAALETASEGRIKPAKRTGDKERTSFLGYCAGRGGYIPLNPPTEDFDIKAIYGM